MSAAPHQPTPAEEAAAAVEAIWTAVDGGAGTTLVDSPPGAGKSTLTRDISGRLVAKSLQVPVVVQTNSQADDMVHSLLVENQARLQRGDRALRVGRLHRAGWGPPDWLTGSPDALASKDLDHLDRADIIVAPAAKWARVSGSWPVAIIDEAYQMKSVDLLWIGAMADELLAVGDPGQVDPFTTADATQFRTMPLSPISPAALTLAKTQPDAQTFALPVSWRLTPQAAALVSAAFYRTPFTAGTAAGDRSMSPGNSLMAQPARSTVRQVCSTGWAHLELPSQLMPDNDPEVANQLAQTVLALLDAQITLHSRGRRPRRLTTDGIAVGAAHHSQVNAVRDALAALSHSRGAIPPPVTIDTANTLQGRQFDVTLVWHPLSGRRNTSEFHLDAGRLCVLMSRHLYGCIVVSRAGIADQLLASPSTDEYYPDGEGQVDGWLAQSRALAMLRPYVIRA